MNKKGFYTDYHHKKEKRWYEKVRAARHLTWESWRDGLMKENAAELPSTWILLVFQLGTLITFHL
jgi:hypothetical protein